MSKLKTVYVSCESMHSESYSLMKGLYGSHGTVEAKQLYLFTPEELKKLLEDYTNIILENATTSFTNENPLDFIQVAKDSITSQLPSFLKENGYD